MSNDQSQSIVLIHNVPHKISEGQAKLLMFMFCHGHIKTQGLSQIELSNLAKLQVIQAVDVGVLGNTYVLKPGVQLEGDE